MRWLRGSGGEGGAHGVAIGSRRSTYTLVLGVVIGLLGAGLAIPYLFGTPLHRDDALTAGGPPEALSDRAAGVGATGGGDMGGDVSAADGGATTGTPGATSSADATNGPGSSGSAGGGDVATPSTVARGAAGAALRATDRGVTAKEIRLAFMLADLGGVSKIGFSVPGYNPDEQKRYATAYIDAINARGGILGRKVVPLFFEYDPTNPSTQRAACLAATRDHEIFAAIDSGSSLDFPTQLCFTEQNRTPLFEFGTFGTTQELYRASRGFLFTILQSGVRSLANTAAELHRQGRLKGKKIGIIDRDFPGTVQTVTDGMVAVLERLGYRVTERVDLSADNGTAGSQVPVAVQQMRSKGVDAVMLLTDFIIANEFVQAAERSGYTPDYFVSDFEAMTNDIAISAMPPSFRAVGITATRQGEWRAGIPEPAVDAQCGQTYAKATGTRFQRSDPSYNGMLLTCGLVDLFERGATRAGANLTRAAFSDGIQGIGALAFPFLGGSSYRRGKFDAADRIRTIVAERSCRCWMPTGAFIDPHY